MICVYVINILKKVIALINKSVNLLNIQTIQAHLCLYIHSTVNQALINVYTRVYLRKNFFIKYNLQIRCFNDHEFLFDHYKGFISLE